MNLFRKITITAGLVAGIAFSVLGQDKPSVAAMAATKFAALPGMPACMTPSAQRGDPTKGPAVILAKFTPGCTVPWHWHTAGEGLMMVSGKAKVEMKDAAAAAPLAPGDYVYLPGKHPHLFTSLSPCTLFHATQAPFAIPYTDQ